MADLARDIANLKRIRDEFMHTAARSAPPASAPEPPPLRPSIEPQQTVPEAQPKIEPKQQAWRYEKYDGTFAGIVRHYRADSGSPYFKLHWKVRKNYDLAINKIMLQIGSWRVADVKASDKAHEMGRPSIALAQAIQFDLKLRQVDVIGEWVPVELVDLTDHPQQPPPIIWDRQKWTRGIQWI